MHHTLGQWGGLNPLRGVEAISSLFTWKSWLTWHQTLVTLPFLQEILVNKAYESKDNVDNICKKLAVDDKNLHTKVLTLLSLFTMQDWSILTEFHKYKL